MQMREKSHVVKPLLGLMRPYTLQILLCVVLVMLFNGADLIKPWIMEIAVDDYLTPMIAGEPAQTGGFFLFQSLTGLGVSYFLVVVIGALASIFQSRLLARVCQSILNTMRLKLFDHIHRLKPRIWTKSAAAACSPAPPTTWRRSTNSTTTCSSACSGTSSC